MLFLRQIFMMNGTYSMLMFRCKLQWSYLMILFCRAPAETSSETNDVSIADNATLEHFHNEEQIAASSVFTGHSRGTHTSSTRSTSKHLDVEELEMLLEAYFVQIDGTLNKLSTVINTYGLT